MAAIAGCTKKKEERGGGGGGGGEKHRIPPAGLETALPPPYLGDTESR
jgi:hypothetical protein